MDIISGDYYKEKYQTKESSRINFRFDTRDYLIYEVLRTTRGVMIFYEDHMNRMNNSLMSLGIETKYNNQKIKQCLQDLLSLNDNRTGNIKILFKTESGKLYFTAYYIPHEYPTDKMYRVGVKLNTYEIGRPEPNIKQVPVSEHIKSEIEFLRTHSPAYETVLINNKKFITEGSKSNIFFIRRKKLFSPPDDSILLGITRHYVLKIARKYNLEVIKKPVSYNEIASYESAFICGTSAKILPVCRIDDIIFRAESEIITLIHNEYNTIIQNYIDKKISKEG